MKTHLLLFIVLILCGLSLSTRLLAQGALENGGNHEGATSPAGDEDTWTFSATIGDTIILRCGETSGTASYNPFLRLIGPTGILIAQNNSTADTFIAVRATNNGTFSAVVSSGSAGHTGTYILRLVQIPGAFVVPVGDEGGPLTNGGDHTGTNSIGDEDMWTFTATIGDNITLRCGEIVGTVSYNPYVRLYGPTGILIDSDNNASDSYINIRATNSGTFTVVVGSGFAGHAGSYNLRYAKAPGDFIVSLGDEGGALTNGVNHLGVTTNGDEDVWTFDASIGDNITLRCGELTGTASYNPYVRLIGPTGIQIALDNDTSDSYINHRATNSGTFTVIVGAWFRGHTGTYSLRYVKAPGTFFVPSDDEGGPLVNGGNHQGTNSIGDEDMWSFTAEMGEEIILRCGELSGSVSYNPWVRLLGPTGILIDFANNASDSFINHRTTNSGTFTVIVGSYSAGHTGSYSLRYLKVPGPFIVPPDDEGGSLSGDNHEGIITLGDEDIWRFTVCPGEPIALRCVELTGTVSFNPWLGLYGPTGVLIASANHASESVVNHISTNGGTYTVVIGSFFAGHTGTYRLTHNNLTFDFKNCVPRVNESNLTLRAVGGVPSANFVALTSTDVTAPLAGWTPFLTNQFDRLGTCVHINRFDPAELKRFFTIRQE